MVLHDNDGRRYRLPARAQYPRLVPPRTPPPAEEEDDGGISLLYGVAYGIALEGGAVLGALGIAWLLGWVG